MLHFLVITWYIIRVVEVKKLTGILKFKFLTLSPLFDCDSTGYTNTFGALLPQWLAFRKVNGTLNWSLKYFDFSTQWQFSSVKHLLELDATQAMRKWDVASN